MRTLILTLALVTAVGCESQGSYESFRTAQRFQCQQLPPSQYDQCMADANTPYNEYRRDREELFEEED